MSNISASRGLNVPTFQPAGKKGDGSAGNGAGGMYFGQEEPPPEEQAFNPFDFRPRFGLEDVPFSMPNFGPKPKKMDLWKLALATAYYKKYASDPIQVQS